MLVVQTVIAEAGAADAMAAAPHAERDRSDQMPHTAGLALAVTFTRRELSSSIRGLDERQHDVSVVSCREDKHHAC